MRHRKYFLRPALACALFLYLTIPASAAPVSPEMAAGAAQGWLRQDHRPLGKVMSSRVKRTETIPGADGTALYYVVHLDPAGFVIMPADDGSEPVVAFSASGDFDASSKSPLASLINHDLPKRVARARANLASAPALKSRGKWRAFLAGSANPPPDTDVNNSIVVASQVWVAPFIQTLWSQDQDVSGTVACYDYYAPPGPDGSTSNDPCGCVATCMAQVMYYFQYPNTGVGTGTFDITVDEGPNIPEQLFGGDGLGGVYQWGNMPLSPNYPTVAQATNISALTHDAAATVNMDYAPAGSGALTKLIPQALTSTFKFANAGYYESDFTLNGSNMLNMINPNLDARLPVMLGIETPQEDGHCLICDGYGYSSGTLFHHVNAGWGGDDDIWYTLPNIDTFDGQGDYTEILSCVYNIYTNGSGQIISGRVTDPAGVAVAGASITAVRSGGGTYTAVTDANGVYALPRIPASSTYTLTATNAGYNSKSGSFSTGTSVQDHLPSGNIWGANFVLSPPLLAMPETGFAAIGPPGGPFSEDSTNYVLTNSTTAAINWQIGNTNSWLGVSASSGNLAAGAATGFTVYLTAAANVLGAGTYAGSIWITNQTTGLAQQLAYSLSVAWADYPIAVTGYNMDVIVENTALGGNTLNYASAFDLDYPYDYPSACFYESGLEAINFQSGDAAVSGLPSSGLVTNEFDHATTFQFGPYTGSNVLYLTSSTSSGSLALAVPSSYKSLSILAGSAGGGGNGSLVIHFADGSSSTAIAFNANNYLTTNHAGTGAALTNFGLLVVGNYIGGYIALDPPPDTSYPFPNLYQTSIDLHSMGLDTNTIDSITFTKPGGGDVMTGVFAVSGTASGAFAISVSASPAYAGAAIGAGTFLSGTTNTVSAMASNNYVFTDWTLGGNVVGVMTNYTFILSNNTALIANFAPLYSIAVSVSTNGGGSAGGNTTNAAGTTNTVTAVASNGYAFANWTEGGNVVSVSNNYNFVLNGDTALVANFLPLYTISVSALPSGDGAASGNATNLAESMNTVTAAASNGFVFTGWTAGGGVLSTATNYTFPLESNISLTANFSPSFTVAVSASPANGGTVGGGGAFASNSTVVVTATPANGYGFSGWTLSGIPASSSNNYSFILTNSVALVANFALAPPQISVFDGTNAIASGQTNAVSFGAAGQNQTGTSIFFTVTNSGGQALDLSGIAVPAGFALDTNYSTVIPGLSNGSFTVQLATTAIGVSSGDIVITNSDPTNSPFTFPVTGTVLGPAQLQVFAGTTNLTNGQTTPIAFGIIQQGHSGTTVAFTMTNSGGQTLEVQGIAVPSGFTLNPGFPTAIAAGSNGTFSVQLNTATAGTFSGNVTITNTGSTNTFSFAVTGTVAFPALITLVSSPSGEGTISVGGVIGADSFPEGSSQSVFATPINNFKFIGWSGGLSGTNNPMNVTIAPGMVIQANFAINTSGITVVMTTSGSGSVSPNPNGKTYKAGTSLTFAATPGRDSGQVFSNWTGSITTNKNPLTVSKIQSSMVLQANFVPNPFPQYVGTYNGLFTAANSNFTQGVYGMLKGLTISAKGTYSGALLINGTSKSISGAFGLGGQATNTVALGGTEGSATLAMNLNPGSAPYVTGTVSNLHWLATNLLAEEAAQTPVAAVYTMLLPGAGGAGSIGDGYASLSITKGAAKITGGLPDGTAFSQSVALSSAGDAPVYAAVTPGKDVLAGWINLNPTNQSRPGLTRVSPVTGSTQAGFTGMDNLLVSPWSNSVEILSLTNLSLTAGLNIVTNGRVKITATGGISGSLVTGTVNTKTGVISLTAGSGAAKSTGHGAVLLNQTNGGGYFLGKDGPGILELQP